jgi:hypothetical protein
MAIGSRRLGNGWTPPQSNNMSASPYGIRKPLIVCGRSEGNCDGELAGVLGESTIVTYVFGC